MALYTETRVDCGTYGLMRLSAPRPLDTFFDIFSTCLFHESVSSRAEAIVFINSFDLFVVNNDSGFFRNAGEFLMCCH